jgi:hypothetical protein
MMGMHTTQRSGGSAALWRCLPHRAAIASRHSRRGDRVRERDSCTDRERKRR